MVIEIIQNNPRISLLLISAGVSLFITLINLIVLDKDKMRQMKKRQKEISLEMKEHKNDPAKVMELQKEMMSHMGENLKHSFKPMLITLIPVLIAFGWIRGIFEETTIASSWLWYYIGGALVSSLLFRKVFKLP